MIVKRGMNLKQAMKWSGHHVIWLLLWSSSVAFLYVYNLIEVKLPWLPISIIGTAVAFYVGFKNNSAYDRMWEARKIWGGIVNSSRSWGMYVDGFITNQFADASLSDMEIKIVKSRLIYRHIAWLYALRSQLLVSTEWEHINQNILYRISSQLMQKNYGLGLVEDELTGDELQRFLPKGEHDCLLNASNTATQIINEQSRDIRTLRSDGLVDDFRHMELSKTLSAFYDHQGKAERIKKFPLPRQYANLSRIFIGIFIFLVPFSMIPSLMNLGTWGAAISVMMTALIGWVYIMMEIVGDYSENPFQGMANDIPMLSLCRTIEIDLLEMLGETDLPAPIKPKKGVLM
ncbi:bestrophin family protein [Saccharicrinis aurantiacus]|uniref:bestrophin family protein n=1 Tax=Saccharicrinis aurantiacus TaxID=1849719 RepID=UPI002492D1B8|nr:bestrophin family ion channel [Saccharicrinis aurantiacus]